MITDAKAFGDTLRRRRKELGYTRAFLSECSRFSVTFISDLENGKSHLSGQPAGSRLYADARELNDERTAGQPEMDQIQ